MHTLPFTSKLDWPDITAALREIGYKGVLTFECDAFIERLPDDLKIAASKFMFETGKSLVKMIENK
jgi:sugar phosphate isomerase/epimerase